MSLQEYIDNRKNLYDNLLGDGYFRGEDGEINFSFEEFSEGLDNRDNAIVFYENLLSDGYFKNEDGSVQLPQSDFLEMIGSARPVQDFYPITENQRGVYIDWDMNRDTTQYNIADVTPIHGHSAQEAKDAVIQVINAHPYIKTRLVLKDGDVMQQRRDADLPEVSIESLDFEPDTVFFQKRVRPFDLLNDRLYRIEVYQTPSSVLIFTDFHHIVFDGGSALIFTADLFAALAGEKLSVESYSAYERALEEHTFWNSDACHKSEAYFDATLTGIDATVYPHSSKETGEPVRQLVETSIPCSEIEDFCRRNEVTESNYFLTMLMQVLHRVTREEDVLITTIHHGRTDLRMLNAMGMFVKTQPAVSHSSTKIGQTVTVKEAVQATQKQMLETQRHDIYSFTKMVERYGIRAEIMYVFQGGGSRESEDRQSDHFSLELNTAKLPVSLVVMPEGPDLYKLRLEYDGSLYSRADMETLNRMVAESCLSAVRVRVLSEVAILSEEERTAVVDLSRGEDLDVDISKTFIESFTEKARQIPEALAVADEHSSFTYGEIDRKSDAMAHFLIENGVQPDDFVCIMLDRCKEFVMCVHAIHKAAAAYVPLDTDYPSERLRYMLDDCRAPILVTTHSVMEKKCSDDNLDINPDKIKILYLEDLNLDRETSPICLAKPENLAYMIYTSGSTGKPKGTMLHQAGLMNTVGVVMGEQNITSADKAGFFYAFSFDAHIVPMYAVLIAGGSLHIMPSSIRKDMELVVAFIKERGITIVGMPTAVGSLIVQNYPELPVRLISMGGERMDGLSSDRYTIVNAYGPTECTCEVTYFVIPPGKHFDLVPIGRPAANNWGFVTDMYGQLLPQGCAGELCFAGIQVGRGYWNLPEKTAEVFGECPFVKEDRFGRPVRMYHTGDMVRYNEDGELEFIGRIDNQVKLRGFRIELGEIENRAMTYEGISQAAVLVKRINGAEHLCLYYTASDDMDETALRQYLSDALAEYMVPDTFTRMDVMPMTPNGKINRKALPVPVIKTEEIIAPEGDVEQGIFDIAAELLKHDGFGVTTNLLSMGMTSLLAMRLSVMIRQRMNMNIPTQVIFSHPTIREMISAGAPEIGPSSALVYDKRAYYPITENQRGLYIDWELNRDTTQYNMPEVQKKEGFTAEQLRSALIAVVNAHPHLKTRISMQDGDVVQLRNDDEPVCVNMVNMTSEPTPAYFESLVRPFNLFNENLYRFQIIQSPTSLFLFRDFHHIIFDGGSNLLFEVELQKALDGETLIPEAYTAFDRALDEQEMMKPENCAEADAWFDNLLSGGEAILYPKSAEPEEKSPLAGRISISCERKDIDLFCTNNNVTGSNYFLTAFLQVLHRLTREENIIITTINNGRSSAEMMNITGMFVKTMPVASTYDFQSMLKTDFAELAGKTQEQMNETFARDFYPLTRMVERHSIRPNIMFEYQVGAGLEEELEIAGNEGVAELNNNTAKIPLTLGVYAESADTLRLGIEYDASIYNAKDMLVILKAMKEMCEKAAVCEGNEFATISLVPDDEKMEMVARSAGPRMDIDFSKTYMDHFLERASICPDSLAVADDNSSVTYAQLNSYSDLIAARLIELGVRKHDFIGVMIERSKEFPVCVFGIHKAGAAYLPLDIEYPNERLQYMLEDSGANVLITTHNVLDEKRKEGEFNADTILYLDEIDWEKESASLKPVNRCTPDCYTYIIYTSGSTGKPKGVVLHHKGLLNYIFSTIDELHLTAEDRISSHRSFSFDSHIEDLYAILLLGGSLHIMPEKIRKDLQAIRDFVVEHGITGGGYTTSIATMLVNTFDMPVRYISAIGEKLMGVVSREAQIVNAYGPTECTDHITIHYLEKDRIYKDIPIGHVIANSWCFIVDSAGQLAPMGACGELCIAGIQVGIGYWHLPERTEQSFVECPFVDHNIDGTPVRMYHTGDLARFNDQGELECLGRIDNQVKLRGYRVELGEIETEAMKVDGVQQSVAMIREINGDKHLVLYYTVDDGKSVEEEVLDDFMKQSKLPAYMVPEVYMQMDAMPRTPNGKINRRALPVPEMSVGEIELPANESEARLFEIAKKVLKTENFGVTTNLMNVGMNSLSAMRLSASIQQELGINVPTRSIMQSPTVREIVGLSVYPEELETDIAIVHAPRDYYPVSENQRGIYVEWELNRNTTQYNVPLVQKMDGIDAETLRDALVVVVEAHPYLKNRFAMHDDDIVQVRNESEPAAVTLTEIEMEPDRSFFQQKVKPFDLLSDRLYRIEVVKTPSSVYLFADVHHTIFDGGSQFIFMSELEKVLSGETLEKETYTAWDRALDEQEMMRSGKFEDARNYFDRTLGEAEIASYPHSSGVKESGNRACILNTRINAAGITEFCRKNGITENSFFMSVTSIVLQRLTREDKLIFTSICNGRTNVRMQSIMGMFVKTLPVVSVDAKGSFAEYADRIQQQFIQTQEYGGIYPYTHLVSRFPANPEIMFAYQGGIGVSDGNSSDDTTVALDTAKMPLTISVYPSGGDFVVSLEYSSDFYVSADMEKLASVFSLVAGQACDSGLKVEDYRLVSDSEMKSLTRLGKGRTLKYDTKETLVSIMRRQAQTVPDNTMIVFRDRSYTYRQIDEQTDRIAAHLIGMGVTHEQAIGVMIERSELLFIYSMAIMKAGCSYMPLDPHFPEDRLMFMCEDAGVRIILSDQGLARKVMPAFSGKVLYRNDFDNVKRNVASWPEVKADDRMVILYTSGSTGKPKGVELEHHGIVNYSYWYVKEFGMTGEDRAVGYANYGFDAHMIDLYPTMLAGASAYIFPEEMRLDLNAMNDYIEQNHLTVAFMTTQIACQMVTLFNSKSLRMFSTGGEKMPSITPPAYRFVNGYGPTECSLYSTFYDVRSYFEGEFIGRALDNYQLYIVDKCLQPVPEGVPGELLICGTGVARGYLNRPELNREKFINFRGKKAYRSGDLVRWAVEPRDGSKQIEFLGRIDKQVKLRGLRIELGEIENKVAVYPGIKQVCVDVKEVGGGQNLVCYYVTRDGRDIAVVDLKKKLSEELTTFMIPEMFVKMEEMPLTPNGKVNRKALPVPQVTEALCEPPESENEQVLFDIVKETVGNDNFGVTDDLRHLGMTSLMAIKVVAKANRAGITLKVDELLKSPTIRGVLNLRQTFVYWYNYDDKKPIIVLTQGETAFNHLQSYVKALSEHFAILVVESIKSHAEKIFGGGEDYEDVINMYFDMIDFNMLDANRPITAFTGHCFGGDLCYRLASRWHQEFPEQKPVVCLLDSFWLDCDRECETVDVDDSILPDEILAAKNFFIGEVNKTMEMYRTLNFHGTPDKYDGEVCLFRAMLPEPHVKALADKIGTSEKELEDKYGMTDSLLQKVLLPIRAFDNEAYWRTYLPEIQCCHVEADHLSMLEDKFVDQYVEWVVKHIIS